MVIFFQENSDEDLDGEKLVIDEDTFNTEEQDIVRAIEHEQESEVLFWMF